VNELNSFLEKPETVKDEQHFTTNSYQRHQQTQKSLDSWR